MMIGASAQTHAAEGGYGGLRHPVPVARPVELERETRDSYQQAPRSALDPSSALTAATLIAGRIPGAKVVSVLPTGSMRPMFDQKAFLVVEPANYEDLRVGDIITYEHPKLRTPVVHRIIEKRSEGYWTKGDYNSRPDDEYVTRANYLMRVCAIIYAREDTATKAPGVNRAEALSN